MSNWAKGRGAPSREHLEAPRKLVKGGPAIRRIVVIVLVLLALPVLWFVWQWYSPSVLWGTSDPCEMIAERLTEETMRAVDPLGLDRLLSLQRPSHLAQETRRVREHGALACWLSVLFGVPTRTEEIHAVVREANAITEGWMDGDQQQREFTLALVQIAEVDVIEHLLTGVGGKGQSALRLRSRRTPGASSEPRSRPRWIRFVRVSG